MNSKVSTMFIAIVASIALWLIGGFVFGKAVGMVCVMIGIALVGLAAGNCMNSPAPEHEQP